MLSVDFLNALIVSGAMGYFMSGTQHLLFMVEVVSLYDFKINLRITFTWHKAVAGKTFQILIYCSSLMILWDMEQDCYSV